MRGGKTSEIRRKSVGAKIYISNFLIILVSISLVFICFTMYNVNILQDNVQTQMENNAESTLREIESRINMLNTISIQIASSPVVFKTMKEVAQNENNDFKNNIFSAHEIYEYIWSYIIVSDSANSVSIYNNVGDYIYTGEGMTFTSTNNFKIEKELLNKYVSTIEKIFQDVDQKKVVFNKRNDDKNGAYYNDNIVLVRPIKGSPVLDTSTIAYVEVGLKTSDIERVLHNSAGEDENYILYEKGTDNVVCASEDKGEYEDLAYQVKVDMEEYEYTLVLNKSNLQITQLIHSTIITCIALYLLLIISLALVQRKVNVGTMLPLVELCQSINNLDEWKMKTELTSTSKEVYELTEAFSQLINKLEQSIQEQALAKTGETTAHLFALQSQINPHFIHNTLAVIQAYAGEENYTAVDQICENLSEMIRYSSDFRSNKSMISAEVQHANHYMQLMKLRYESDLIYHIHNNIQNTNMMVPCFIIQPLLENCIAHGFANKPYPWSIDIEIDEQSEFWEIVIRDNGQGISEQYEEEIQAYVRELKLGEISVLDEKLALGGLSVKNVIARLYLEYGNKMIFSITNKEDGGTEVIMGATF